MSSNIINKEQGFFNVRRYTDGKPREQWPLLTNGENIVFTYVKDGHAPAELHNGATELMYKDMPMYRIKVKIGRNCVWFDKDGKKIDRLSNELLDGKRWQVSIQFNSIDPDPNKPLSPRGLWARAIMIHKEVEECPFIVEPQPSEIEVALTNTGTDAKGQSTNERELKNAFDEVDLPY